jgi:hypothetical protein
MKVSDADAEDGRYVYVAVIEADDQLAELVYIIRLMHDPEIN